MTVRHIPANRKAGRLAELDELNGQRLSWGLSAVVTVVWAIEHPCGLRSSAFRVEPLGGYDRPDPLERSSWAKTASG